MQLSQLTSIVDSRVDRALFPVDVERIVGDVLAVAGEHEIDIPDAIIRTLTIHAIRGLLGEVNHADERRETFPSAHDTATSVIQR